MRKKSVLQKAKVYDILFVFKFHIDPFHQRTNMEIKLFCFEIVLGPGTNTVSFQNKNKNKVWTFVSNLILAGMACLFFVRRRKQQGTLKC